ncbi:MAG: class A beta-lactamase [Candidatus Latescibacteria bacterium]|nr:class A beta-lactamase [Candidatus Latescibacterota bacterium]
MHRFRTTTIAVVLGLAVALQYGSACAQEDPGLLRLENEIARLASPSGGTVGVGVIHIETGREIFLNADERFPMASSYKVPIAIQLLTKVDRSEISLQKMIEIEEEDLHPGSGTLSELFDDPGVILSLRNYLELMLLISDNSATDIVLRAAGGSDAVNARMQELGITGINVDRPTVELIGDFIGIKELPPGGKVTPSAFRALSRAVSQQEREEASNAFDVDPRDTATPRAMASLLARLWQGELLSPESTELLLDIMRRSTTGRERIKGVLPPFAMVAHKTGTIGGTTNDVGIIELPHNAGHVVVAIFVKESRREVETRERVIAHIARAVHDYFLFNPGT